MWMQKNLLFPIHVQCPKTIEEAVLVHLYQDIHVIKCEWRGARWLSGRVSDSGGLGVETYLSRVVSLSKTLYSQKVRVIPRKRWLRPDMTEILLTGTLNLNTNQKNYMSDG